MAYTAAYYTYFSTCNPFSTTGKKNPHHLKTTSHSTNLTLFSHFHPIFTLIPAKLPNFLNTAGAMPLPYFFQLTSSI